MHGGLGIFTEVKDGIKASRNQSLALIKENVHISMSPSTPANIPLLKGVDQIWLEVKSNIIVKNLKKLPVNICFGFPISNKPKEAQSHEQWYFKENISKNLINLKFKVTDTSNNKYKTSFFPEDKQKLYVGLFSWNMFFVLEETKSFVVSYHVPLLRSCAFPGSNMYLPGTKIEPQMPEFYSTNEILYGGLSSSCKLQMDYVIMHNCFNRRIKPEVKVNITLLPILNQLYNNKTAWFSESFKGVMHLPKHPYLITLAYPMPDYINNGALYWRKINNSCRICFFMTRFSQNSTEMNKFIDTLVTERQKWLNIWEKIYKDNTKIFSGNFKVNYSKKLKNIERLKKYPYLKEDFHDIYLEFLEKTTQNKRIQSFIKKQVWYGTSRKVMDGFIVMYYKQISKNKSGSATKQNSDK